MHCRNIITIQTIVTHAIEHNAKTRTEGTEKEDCRLNRIKTKNNICDHTIETYTVSHSNRIAYFTICWFSKYLIFFLFSLLMGESLHNSIMESRKSFISDMVPWGSGLE